MVDTNPVETYWTRDALISDLNCNGELEAEEVQRTCDG